MTTAEFVAETLLRDADDDDDDDDGNRAQTRLLCPAAEFIYAHVHCPQPSAQHIGVNFHGRSRIIVPISNIASRVV